MIYRGDSEYLCIQAVCLTALVQKEIVLCLFSWFPDISFTFQLMCQNRSKETGLKISVGLKFFSAAVMSCSYVHSGAICSQAGYHRVVILFYSCASRDGSGATNGRVVSLLLEDTVC